MMLMEEVRRKLLEDRGIYVKECWGKCGQLLSSVRYTRRGEAGVWCSRECRDGAEAHTPGNCKGCGVRLPEGKRRGSLYCDDACKQNAHRSKTGKLSVTKPSIYAGFCTGKRLFRVAPLPRGLRPLNRLSAKTGVR